MFSSEHIQPYLNTEFLGRNIIFYPQTDSTNDDIWKSFHSGVQEGTVIITDNQRKGRGRQSNTWFSTAGKSLTFSFLLTPSGDLNNLGALPLLTGVSIVRSLKYTTAIETGLKWPNDVILDEKKLGGILIETRSSKHGLGIVVGVGLNINESNNDIPKQLQNQATSIFIKLNQNVNRALILSTILNEFEYLYLNQRDEIISLWKKYCVHLGKKITFHSDNHLHHGIFQGITEEGYAKIDIHGKTKTFSAGMVHL